MPSSLFFIMAAAIGAYSPVQAMQTPLLVGLMSTGCLLACLIGFLYSLYALRRQAPSVVSPLQVPSFDFVVFDSMVIGVFVGISLALAQAFQLEKAYWVPVSCLAVIQPIQARFFDTVLGCLVGLAGGVCLHSPRCRQLVGNPVRRWVAGFR
jgi:hypothetical protein